MLRYLELDGELKKAIGVLKKRTGDFEKTLRWFDIEQHGLNVGKPIRGYRGVLRGMPQRVPE
jgi:circadian clock protein KaiC